MLFVASTTLAQEVIPHESKQLESLDSSLVMIQGFLEEELATSIKLSKQSRKQSPVGVHEQFQIIIDGFNVHDAILKRNRFSDGSTLIQYPKFRIAANSILPASQRGFDSKFSDFYSIFNDVYSTGYEWFLADDFVQIAWFISGLTDDDHLEICVSTDGQEIYRRTKRLYSHRDSTIVVNTFQPDPITSSESETSFSLLDNDDANSERLTELMVSDSISVRWDSIDKMWKLESDFTKARDLFSPFISPPTSSNANFSFNRSEAGFEYVNAYYHINNQHRHLEDLGFNDLVNYPIAFDAHGSSLEQSFFDPITDSTGQLAFGEGGVDDAEDADVIIHEYGHAISYDVAPGTAIGTERLAIEEGLCDFFAISYSREYSDYQRDVIFNWDGHNDFWSGRELTYSRTYPSDLEDELYLDAPMWASAIADVYDYYGRDVSETLLITSMYSYFPGMSMVEAAQLYLKADTLLYNNEHSNAISILFCQRGLMPECADTIPSDVPPSNPYIANHGNFSVNKGSLIIYPNGNNLTTVDLIGINGMFIESYSFPKAQIAYELPATTILQGLYIVRINTAEESFSYKVLKLKP